MIVDSSVLVAILLKESDADKYWLAIDNCEEAILLSAANYLETCLVIDAKKKINVSESLDVMLKMLKISVEPVTEQQVKLARFAHQKYGRNSGSKAMLNFGDCFAYALAKERGLPLLYKGDDFIHTDVKGAS